MPWRALSHDSLRRGLDGDAEKIIIARPSELEPIALARRLLLDGLALEHGTKRWCGARSNCDAIF
jgi:hypothetical protein